MRTVKEYEALSQANASKLQLRAIRDPSFDLFKIISTAYPGKAHGTSYTAVPPIEGADEYLSKRAEHYDYPTKIYTGGCHCQALKFAVLCKPLEEVGMTDCNCSICLGVSLASSSFLTICSQSGNPRDMKPLPYIIR